MTVRFKCQTEYQKNYRVSRSRSVSPQRCAPLAGLRSDQMGISREPGLQRRKRLCPGGLAQSHTSLLSPSDPRRPLTEPTTHAHRKVPSASRSRSAFKKEHSLGPNPPTPPKSRARPESPAGPETPSGPQPAADPGPPQRPQRSTDSGMPAEPGKFTKPHPSQPDSQSQPSCHPTAAPDGQQPSATEVDRTLQSRVGLKLGDQRSVVPRSEYHRQLSGKKAAPAPSPILTAQQALYFSSSSVPPWEKKPVSVETEYQRSFQDPTPAAGPRLWKQHQRVPLFHTHMNDRKGREESQRKPRPEHNFHHPQEDDVTRPPPQAERGHRTPEGGGTPDADAAQVKELRLKASSYRRRAWGTNFCRDHLSQLRSEHNTLWEPTDTADSATDPPTPCSTLDLCQDSDNSRTSCVEALDLASGSSKRSSVVGSGEIPTASRNAQTNTQTHAQTPPGPPVDRRMAWQDEEENTDEEEGRLPTPRLKMRPVQRTHHDLTTPASGGAILVGKLSSSGEYTPDNKLRCGSAVSTLVGGDPVANMPVRRTEAWLENSRSQSSGPSSNHRRASKEIRSEQMSAPPAAPLLLIPPPLHGIQGTLRHPDFQHNGELGLRFRELQCSGGGFGSDEDERLSVMSAASCSAASAVLERARKRRESFWGKR